MFDGNARCELTRDDWLFKYCIFLGWDPRLNWLNPYIQKSQHKRKGGQIRFTNEQTDALEHMFDNNKYLSNVQRRKLAKTLSLSERQVRNQT